MSSFKTLPTGNMMKYSHDQSIRLGRFVVQQFSFTFCVQVATLDFIRPPEATFENSSSNSDQPTHTGGDLPLLTVLTSFRASLLLCCKPVKLLAHCSRLTQPMVSCCLTLLGRTMRQLKREVNSICVWRVSITRSKRARFKANRGQRATEGSCSNNLWPAQCFSLDLGSTLSCPERRPLHRPSFHKETKLGQVQYLQLCSGS